MVFNRRAPKGGWGEDCAMSLAMRTDKLVRISPGLPHVETSAGEVTRKNPEISGVATAGDVEIETLFDRMKRESIAGANLLFEHFQIGAWSRT